MPAYYNENDSRAAAWLRELIKANLIAPGVVDERSIEDVLPDDLRGYTQVHLFAGIGGWSYALRLAGWPDDCPVWTGSCPCQPFSNAGKRLGTADKRHLWPVMRKLVSQCSPTVVFGEQVASKDGREWFSGVRTDLEALGYAVGGSDLCAASVGAPHIRPRLFWGASNIDRERLPTRHEFEMFRDEEITSSWSELKRVHAKGSWVSWQNQSRIRPFVDGVPGRVGLLRGYGNAIVPQVAAEFIQAFKEAIDL